MLLSGNMIGVLVIDHEFTTTLGLLHLSGYVGIYVRNTSGHIKGLEGTTSMCNHARSFQTIGHDSTCMPTTKVQSGDDRPCFTRVEHDTLYDTSGYGQLDLDCPV